MNNTWRSRCYNLRIFCHSHLIPHLPIKLGVLLPCFFELMFSFLFVWDLETFRELHVSLLLLSMIDTPSLWGCALFFFNISKPLSSLSLLLTNDAPSIISLSSWGPIFQQSLDLDILLLISMFSFKFAFKSISIFPLYELFCSSFFEHSYNY